MAAKMEIPVCSGREDFKSHSWTQAFVVPTITLTSGLCHLCHPHPMTSDNKSAIKPKENVKQDRPVSHVAWAYYFKISLVAHPGPGLEKQKKRIWGGETPAPEQNSSGDRLASTPQPYTQFHTCVNKQRHNSTPLPGTGS